MPSGSTPAATCCPPRPGPRRTHDHARPGTGAVNCRSATKGQLGRCGRGFGFARTWAARSVQERVCHRPGHPLPPPPARSAPCRRAARSGRDPRRAKPGRPSRCTRPHQRDPAAAVDEVLSQVGPAVAARCRFGSFSLGIRQRLGIAAALLGDPPVLHHRHRRTQRRRGARRRPKLVAVPVGHVCRLRAWGFVPRRVHQQRGHRRALGGRRPRGDVPGQRVRVRAGPGDLRGRPRPAGTAGRRGRGVDGGDARVRRHRHRASFCSARPPCPAGMPASRSPGRASGRGSPPRRCSRRSALWSACLCHATPFRAFHVPHELTSAQVNPYLR